MKKKGLKMKLGKSDKLPPVGARGAPAWPIMPLIKGQWPPGMSDKAKAKEAGRISEVRARDIDALLGENVLGTKLLKRDYPGAIQAEMNEENTCNFCTLRMCCRYTSVFIEGPESREGYDDLLWLVAHKGVNLALDEDGDWSVVIESVCDFLMSNGDCGIYETRPRICREYSNQSCEFQRGYVGQMHEQYTLYFSTHAELLAYCKMRFPLWDDPDWDGVIGGSTPADDAEDSDDSDFGITMGFADAKTCLKAAKLLYQHEVDHALPDGWGSEEIDLPNATDLDVIQVKRILTESDIDFKVV